MKNIQIERSRALEAAAPMRKDLRNAPEAIRAICGLRLRMLPGALGSLKVKLDDEERIDTAGLAHLLGIPHDDILADELEEQRRELEEEESGEGNGTTEKRDGKMTALEQLSIEWGDCHCTSAAPLSRDEELKLWSAALLDVATKDGEHPPVIGPDGEEIPDAISLEGCLRYVLWVAENEPNPKHYRLAQLIYRAIDEAVLSKPDYDQ